MNETATTRETLITAARSLFARHGYAGTSVRAVTGAAGANLGAITYHFGSKRELYDHVVASVVEPLAARIEAVTGGGGDPLERSEAVVREYFAHLRANPDLPQLMMQELVLGGVPPEAVGVPLRRVHGALTRLVQEGQAAGRVRSGPAPVLALFIISAPVHLAMVQGALRAHVDVDLDSPPLRATVVEAAAGFVRQGLAAEGATGRA